MTTPHEWNYPRARYPDAELRVAHQEILHDHEHPSYVRLPLIPS